MKLKNKKVLLTGSSGQVGWELKESLYGQCHLISPERKDFDLSEPESLREKIIEWKPDLIFNPAAYTAVDQAETDHELAFAINAESPKVMAQEAEKLGIPIVHYSTDYIFDGTNDKPYTEKDIPNPINVYGLSKLAGDENIIKTTDNHLIFRTSWVYGMRRSNFLLTMMKLLSNNDEVKVIDDQRGSPTWSKFIAKTSSDISMRILKVNELEEDKFGVFNLSTGDNVSWFDFATEIKERFYKFTEVDITSIESKDYPTKATRPKYSVLDKSKLESTFGVKTYDWIHHFKECVK